MASVFAHALTGFTLSKISSLKNSHVKLYIVAILCTVFPDIDILSFSFGIPYEDPLGHRGFTHSILFAFIAALLLKFILFNKKDPFEGNGLATILFLFVAMASHGVLDAMTTGGRGIAFFWPLDNERYFLPWRVIRVSPIGASNFRGEWAIAVLKSEFYYVGIPCIGLMIMNFFLRFKFR